MSVDPLSPESNMPATGAEPPAEDNSTIVQDEALSSPRGGESVAAQNHIGPNVAHYAIEERIGGGALTAVYRARDTVLDRLVALKVLLQGADETMRERFRREARTAAMLEHPNIVRTYQVGMTEGSGLTFIAMELVQGPSLSELLDQVRVMEPADAAAILEPIARALAYAHERGVVHRDVKPSNILLQSVDFDHPLRVETEVGGGAFAPLLSDFGIARALDAPELTSEGRTIGTPAFMSPEQCSGSQDIDGRADIYSLGAVLYRCLVGRTPYTGSTTQILHAHVYDPLTIPSDVLQRLPPGAVEILQRSLAKDPANRYGSATGLANALAALSVDHARVSPAHPTNVDDETAEMPARGAPVGRQAPTSAHVLIPARAAAPVQRMAAGAGTSAKPSTTEHRVAPASPLSRKRTTRTGVIVLALALTTLVAMLVITFVSGILPAMDVIDRPTSEDGDAGPNAVTPSGVGAGVTPIAGANRPLSTTADAAAAPGVTQTPARPATEQAGGARPTVTPQGGTLQVSPEFAWRNARDLFEDADWNGAREWLIAVRRADPELETEAVAALLAESDVRLAMSAVEAGEYEQANDLLTEAAEATGGARPYTRLQQAVAKLVEPDANERESLLEVQRALVGYAAFLAGDERYCEALDQIAIAEQLDESQRSLAARANYEALCVPTPEPAALLPLTGRILFSAQAGDQYSVYDLGVDGLSAPRPIIGDASQPSLGPDGATLAFYDRGPNVQGLTMTRLSAGQDVGAERVRLTNYVEDARDAAPSWNPQGDRIAYSSTNFGDDRFRIYLTWADGTRETVELGLGKDPAWHPTEDLIVYNGTDETGNNPGLWLMRTDGTERERLTDNGNDQRPAWLPDGSGLAFMSNGRDGNWELYRLDISTRAVTRLTNNTAQDGLPAVSPDGQYVGFMTDRDGYWSLWYLPVVGGSAAPLAEIGLALPQWLEHSIQWIQ